jgi:hypothetical protein
MWISLFCYKSAFNHQRSKHCNVEREDGTMGYSQASSPAGVQWLREGVVRLAEALAFGVYKALSIFISLI